MITFTKDTPDWIIEWATWAVDCLIPDFEVEVHMKDVIDEDVPDCGGEVQAEPGYLRATVSYKSDLEESQKNIVRVVIHEIVHVFMDNINSSAEALISNKTVRATGWKKFEHAEEESVVRLSRLLYKLRMDGKP